MLYKGATGVPNIYNFQDCFFAMDTLIQFDIPRAKKVPVKGIFMVFFRFFFSRKNIPLAQFLINLSNTFTALLNFIWEFFGLFLRRANQISGTEIEFF